MLNYFYYTQQQTVPGAARTNTKKLFIGGVKDEMTEAEFKAVFSQHGNVESVNIITDKATGKGKGFAFVSFDDHDAVDLCNCKYINLTYCVF